MKRLELLDYARFIAASQVMAFHYLFNGIQNGKLASMSHIPALAAVAKYGYLGVEFFFMISGYVIFFSAKGKTPGEFAVSRATRLYPAFWTAVLFTSAISLFWGGERMAVRPIQVLANFTMIPAMLGQGFVDGVYWTLQLELTFYAAVLVALMIGLQGRLERMFLAWPFIMLAARFLGMSQLPLTGGYYAYFAAGAVFGIVRTQRDKLAVLSLLVALFLCMDYSSGMAPSLSVNRGVSYSSLVIGMIIAAQFMFFVFLTSARGSSMRLPGSKLAGALTYPVYLVHAHFGYMFLSRFGNDQNRLPIYCLTVALVLVVAYLIHVLVERRLASVWRRLFWSVAGRPIDAVAKRLYAISAIR